ncbi:hypothetical protein D3C81_1612680 [compost metagenome]
MSDIKHMLGGLHVMIGPMQANRIERMSDRQLFDICIGVKGIGFCPQMFDMKIGAAALHQVPMNLDHRRQAGSGAWFVEYAVKMVRIHRILVNVAECLY